MPMDGGEEHALYAPQRTVTDPVHCFFYHSMDLPGHGTMPGSWDLRGREAEYLGLGDPSASLANKRVLEIGPGSGGLTFWMEAQGASVTSLELASNELPDCTWDLPSNKPADFDQRIAEAKANLARLHNAWWFAHSALKSSARVHYRNANGIPAGLGSFDVVTVAAVLLHNKTPQTILENAARVSTDTLIVVEVQPPGRSIMSRDMIFLRDKPAFYDGWFLFPPRLTVRMLKSMGFSRTTTTFHRQLMQGQPYGFYTVVARR